MSGCSFAKRNDDPHKDVLKYSMLEIPPGLDTPVGTEALLIPEGQVGTGYDLDESPAALGSSITAKSLIEEPLQGVSVFDEQGIPVLLIDDELDSSWRRLRFTIEHLNFQLLETDIVGNRYRIFYQLPQLSPEELGFFRRLWRGTKKLWQREVRIAGREYWLALSAMEGKTKIAVQSSSGVPMIDHTTATLLSEIAKRLGS